MKRYICVILSATILLSCGGNENSEDGNDTSAVKKMDTVSSGIPTLKPDSLSDNMPVLKDTSDIEQK